MNGTSLKILKTLSLAASDAREDTLKSIIIHVTYEYHEILLGEICKKIRELYLFEPNNNEINIIIKKLQDDNKIIVEKDTIRLSDDEKKHLNDFELEIKTEESNRFQNFKNFITDILKKTLDVEEIKLLYTTYIDYIYNSFYRYGEDAIRNFTATNISNNKDKEDFVQEAFKKIENKELLEIFKLVIDKFPENALKSDVAFLNEIFNKTQAFTSLGISPEYAEEINRMNLVDWFLYLDTNVIYSLLDLHYNPETVACKALVKLITENPALFKIKLRYSDLTIKELQNKKNEFKLLDTNMPKSSISALLKSDKLDEFSRKFYTNLLEDPKSTLHPSKVIDISNTILKNDGIDVARTNARIDKLGEKYLELKMQDYLNFIDNKNQDRKDFGAKKNVNLRTIYRSDKQAYHDVAMRELILDSRRSISTKGENVTLNSIKYYALTLDDLLVQFDQKQRSNSGDHKSYPVFFKPSFLLNKLVKLLPLNTDDYQRAYLKAITSRVFYRDIKRSDDVQSIVLYLKKRGIDNEEIITNLITEELFLEKYRQNSQQDDFNSEEFIENEINRQFTEKQKELEKVANELNNTKSETAATKNEAAVLYSSVEKLQTLIKQYEIATTHFSKRIKQLESNKTGANPQIIIDFESSEKDNEISKLRGELANIKRDEITKKRGLYEAKKLRNWRLRSFIPLTVFVIISGLLLGFNNWSFSFAYNDGVLQPTIPIICSVIVVGFGVWVYNHIYNRYQNPIYIKDFKANLKYPKDLDIDS